MQRSLSRSWHTKRPRQHAAGAQQSSGFTIIEVLIVLAIAGIILLIVFEAIPALTRSSRNNQRKQEVTAILDAVSHYELANSGDLPTGTSYLSNTPLSIYNATNVTLTTEVPSDATPLRTNTTTINPEDVKMYNYSLCDSSSPGNGTAAGAGYNDVIALYSVETGSGGFEGQCQDLAN